MQGHFWSGARCFAQTDKGQPAFPAGVTVTTDVITVMEDLSNKIPDKSWMLYLLEMFDIAGVPVELNLIAQFNSIDNFWAIFGGVNRYKFTSVLPQPGHSYFRQIELDEGKNQVRYYVEDRASGMSENFDFPVSGGFGFRASGQFTGVEWWNRIADRPFPVRYGVEFSSIQFKADKSWNKFSLFIPDTDGSGARYPVGFRFAGKGEGVSYTVGNGETVGGLSP